MPLLCNTLLYDCKTWMLSGVQEKKINIYDASVVYLEEAGKEIPPTKKCWEVLVSPPFTLPSVSQKLAVWVMFLRWVKSNTQSVYCTASYSLTNAIVQLYVCKRDLNTWMSALMNARNLLVTAADGNVF